MQTSCKNASTRPYLLYFKLLLTFSTIFESSIEFNEFLRNFDDFQQFSLNHVPYSGFHTKIEKHKQIRKFLQVLENSWKTASPKAPTARHRTPTARPLHAHRTPQHAHRTPTARPQHNFSTSSFLWLLSTFFKIFMEIDCFCKFLVISRESREFEWFLANSAMVDGCQRFSGFCRSFIGFHVFCRFQMIVSDFHESECFLSNFTVSNGFE